MAQPASSSAAEKGVPAPSPASPEPAVPDKASIERLGRQRPAVFRTAIAEAVFVAAIVMSMSMSEYFISGFPIIQPTVAAALDIPAAARTWPAAVPNLTTAAFLLPFARLADMYGGRRLFAAGHAWTVVWSLAAGFSRGPAMLIVCRAAQGVGFSAFLPANLALLGAAYRPGPRKNLVYCLYGAFACIGFYFGIILGAVTGQLLSWHWYFWIGAVIALVIVVAGWLYVPRHVGDGDPDLRMDWWGLCTIVPGLVLVVFALTDGGNAPDGWDTPYIYVTFILGGLFLCAAVYVEGWVAAQPLLSPDLFKPKYMKRLLASVFCSFGVFGLFLFYASYYIETVLNTTPLQTAAWFTPLAGGGIILALAGGFVLHLIPGRLLLLIAGVAYLICSLLFALIPERSDSDSIDFLYWAYVFPAMICGTIGVDTTFNVLNVFITTSMPRRLQAAAGALTNSLLYLGMSFWLGVGELAVSTSVSYHEPEGLSLRQQYKIGFWTAVGLAGLSLILMLPVKMGNAESDLTADEKAEAERNGTEP
ncbi:major facilitator superfamily domain-containing protein [Xylariomycetidae sp. FL0641]|nr:major facilitator superfamily domain-containing protein [Xylariomycetidae sp. FL0641]